MPQFAVIRSRTSEIIEGGFFSRSAAMDCRDRLIRESFVAGHGFDAGQNFVVVPQHVAERMERNADARLARNERNAGA